MASSSIEEALVAKIKTIAAVTAYIGAGANAHIYFMSAPEGTLTEPYIVLTTISSPNEARYIGQDGSVARIQLSAFHTHKQNGLDLANALVDGLSHFSGTSDGYNIQYVNTTGPIPLKDPDYDNVYQYIVDAIVEYDRS